MGTGTNVEGSPVLGPFRKKEVERSTMSPNVSEPPASPSAGKVSLKDAHVHPTVVSANTTPELAEADDHTGVERMITTMLSYKSPLARRLSDRPPPSTIKSIIQDKENELAKIAEQRRKLVEEQVEQLQKTEQGQKEEIAVLRGQLKQLTEDFQYNLKLLQDRDAELDSIEKHLTVQKEVDSARLQELSDAQRHVALLQRELTDCQNQIRSMQAQLEASKKECERDISEVDASNKQALNSMQLALSEANVRLQRHIDESAQEREELVRSHKHVLEEAHLATQHNTNEAEKWRRECSRLQDEADRMREKTERMRADIHYAEAAIQSLKKEHSNVLAEALQGCKRKDEEIEALHRSMTDLQSSADKRHEELSKIHDAALEKHRRQHREDAAQMQEDMQRVRMASSQMDEARQAVQREMSQMQQERDHARSQLDGQQRSNLEKDTVIANLKFEVAQLQLGLANANEKAEKGDTHVQEAFSQAESTQQELQRQIRVLQEELDELRTELACANKARDAAALHLQHLSSEMDQLTDLSSKIVSKAEARTAAAERMAMDAAAGKSELQAALQCKVAALEQKIQSMEAQAEERLVEARARHERETAHLQTMWQSQAASKSQEFHQAILERDAEASASKVDYQAACMRVNAAEAHIKLLEARLAEHSSSARVDCCSSYRRGGAAVPTLQGDGISSDPARPLYRDLLSSLQEHVHQRVNAESDEAAHFVADKRAQELLHNRAQGLPDAPPAMASNQAVLGPDARMQPVRMRPPMAELSGNRARQDGHAAGMYKASTTAAEASLGALNQHCAPVGSWASTATGHQANSNRVSAMDRMQRLHERLQQKERDISERMQRIMGYTPV